MLTRQHRYCGTRRAQQCSRVSATACTLAALLAISTCHEAAPAEREQPARRSAELTANDAATDNATADLEDGADDGLRDGLRDGTGIWLEQAKLLASTGMTSDRFGYAVAVHGDTAVVGATVANLSGRAFVFVRNGNAWQQQKRLQGEGSLLGTYFGDSVAVFGDTAIVGAPGDIEHGAGAGAAYVFTRSGNTWTEQAKLPPDTVTPLSPNDSFGTAVALSGDTAVVGATGDDEVTGDAGAAYVFVRSGSSWYQQGKLLAADGAVNDALGGSVAISGDRVIVGASGDDNSGPGTGAAYVFVRSGSVWSQHDKLLADDGAAGEHFGSAVALSDDTALVGAPHDGVTTLYAGSAYFFTLVGDSWTQQAKVNATPGSANAHFGTAVALDGDRAVIGADNDGQTNMTPGAGYIFERSASSWSQQQKLVATDGATEHHYGSSVALSGDTVLVGAPEDDDLGNKSGSAYVVALHGQPCAAAEDCPSTYCVDGVCCNEPCGDEATDDCQACSAALTAPDGQDGICDILADSSLCSDGVYCNGPESCHGGACQGSSDPPCYGVADGDEDCSETCDEDADACSAPDPDGTRCAAGGSCIFGACLAPPGAECTAGSECLTERCLDGVCCMTDSCAPYRCSTGGLCHLRCTSNADCAQGFECSAAGNCAAPSSDSEDAGCSCSAVGLPASRSGAAWWAALAPLVGLARMRRRR